MEWRGRFFAPDAGEGGLDLTIKTGEQFPVRGDEGLLGLDPGHDGLLRGEGWAKGPSHSSLGQRPRKRDQKKPKG